LAIPARPQLPAFLNDVIGPADPNWPRGVEDMVANYRSGVSQDLSPQALSWAKQQPYLQQWSLGKTSNVADQFPILNGLL
jgi:hypothetical protein